MQRVVNRLSPQVDVLAIAAGEKADNGYGLGLAVLADTVPGGFGPLAGLLAGLEWASAKGFNWVMSAPCDVPFLPRDLVRRLREAVDGKDLSLASSKGRTHHVIGLWPAGLAKLLRQRIVEEGLREVGVWAASFRVGIAVWSEAPFDPFHNINWPEDLETAQHVLEEFDP
jgi:molybdopterin-guanine dinucleotide biosynthesis protein A